MNEEKEQNNGSKKKISKEQIKTIVIAVLAVTLLGFVSSDNTQELSNKIENLTDSNNNLSAKIVELNEVLDQKNKEIQNLENAQNEIAANNQISQDTSSSNTLVTDNSASQSTSNNSNDENEQLVWVGNSGTKYHNQGCRTLKGNGHQITLEKALSEGRQPCKVCH